MPKTCAAKVLDKYWDKNTIPINPIAISAAMGVDVYARPDNAMEGHSGIYLHKEPETGNPTIIYNTNEPRVRQRFTVAHELGHHCLKHGESFRDARYLASSKDRKEADANAFAAEILMPEIAVHAMINVRRVRDINRLAHMFDVSTTAMSFRLQALGYVRK